MFKIPASNHYAQSAPPNKISTLGRLYTLRKFTVPAADKTNSSCIRQEFCLFHTRKLFVSSADKTNGNVYTTRFFSFSRQSGVGRASNNKCDNQCEFRLFIYLNVNYKAKKNDNSILLL